MQMSAILKRLNAITVERSDTLKRHVVLRQGLKIQDQETRDSKRRTYVTAEEDSDLEIFTVLTVTSEDTELYKATFSVNGVDFEMEVDIGARKSIISERTYRRQFSHIPLQSANVKLRAYNGGRIPVLGQITATVKYQGQRAVLPLLVIKGHGATLCGRDWLRQLILNWAEIKFFEGNKM